MLEILKNLSKGSKITLDNEDAIDFTNKEDYKVSEARHLQSEDGECVILDLGDYFLIGYSFEGDNLYYLCEINSEEDYEADLDEIEIDINNKTSCYSLETDKWICQEDDVEVEIQKFTNTNEDLKFVIQEVIANNSILYLGLEIDEESIVI